MKKKVLLIITTLVVTSIVTVKTGLTSKACQICEEAIAAGLDATHIDEDAPATDQAVEEATNEETTELVNPDNVLIPEGTDDESIEEFLNSLVDGTTTEGEETVQGETPSTESDITDGLQTTDEPIIGEDGTVESDETVTNPIPEEEVVMPEIGDSVPSDTESATNPGMEDTGAPDTESSVVNPPIDPEFSQPSETLQPERPEFDKEENKENVEDKKENVEDKKEENKENEEDKKEDTGNKENVEDKKEETENKETTEDKKEDTTLPSTPVTPTIPDVENNEDENIEDETQQTVPSTQENTTVVDEMLEPIDTKTGESKIVTPTQKIKNSFLENVKVLTVNAKSKSKKTSSKSGEKAVSIEQEVQLTGNMANIAEMEKSIDKAEVNKNTTKVEKKNKMNFVVTIIVALVIIALGVFAGYSIIKRDREEFLYEDLEIENGK